MLINGESPVLIKNTLISNHYLLFLSGIKPVSCVDSLWIELPPRKKTELSPNHPFAILAVINHAECAATY